MILLAGRDSPPEESKIKIGENRQAKRACSFSGSSYSLFIFAILPIFAKPSIFAIFVCQPPWKEHRLDTSHLRHRAPKPQGNRAASPLPADFPLPSALPSGRSPFFFVHSTPFPPLRKPGGGNLNRGKWNKSQ